MVFKSRLLNLFLYFLLAAVVTCHPGLNFQKSDVHEIRKAQIYLQRTLMGYERGREDKYTLYLAVKNYANRLGYLEQEALRQI